MLDGDDLHMAVDVVNDQQLIPILSNYHSTHHYTGTSTYTTSNNNINSDNIDNGTDNDDNNDGDNLNDVHRYHRTTRIIKRRKRFGNFYKSF